MKAVAYALILMVEPLLPACGQSPADFQKAPSFEVNLPGAPFGVEVSRDKQWIFVSLSGGGPGGNPGIAVLHNKDGQIAVVQTIAMQSSPAGIVLTHDGSMLIAAADDAVVFFDTKRLEAGGTDAAFQWVSDGMSAGSVYVNVTADDQTLFVSDERNQSITVIDLGKIRSIGRDSDANWKRFESGSGASDTIIGKIPVGRGPIALTFSKDQRWLFTTSEVAGPDWNWPDAVTAEGMPGAAKEPEGAVIVIDVPKARSDPEHSVVARVPAGGSPVRLAISPDGSRLFVTARGTNEVEVFDTAKLINDPGHATPERVPVGSSPVPVAVVMDGKLALVGNSNRFSADAGKRSTLSVLDVSRIGTNRDPMLGQITCGAFPREFHLSADGKTLFLTNFLSETLQVIDVGRLTAPDSHGLVLSPAVESVASISGTNSEIVLKKREMGAKPKIPLAVVWNHARQIFMACVEYAGDNNDVFPDKISELVPAYLTAEQCKDPLTPNDNFKVLGGRNNDSPPEAVVISSGTTSYGKHIVVDTTGKIEEQ